VPTVIAGGNLAITAAAAAALYSPFGIGGIVAATAIATAASVAAQTLILRRHLGRLELGQLIWTTARVTVASAALAGVSYGVWRALDEALGRGLGGQIVSLSGGLGAGLAVYIVVVTLLRIPEAQQLWRLLRQRA
jgi:peptidoglycan biosynthesis protein MviN/MurJ (putative lipid II flippase)